MNRKLNARAPGRPRKSDASDYSRLKATTVAREIQLEGAPMSIVELTLEAQRRGCRTLDDPRIVAHAIRTGLAHIAGSFGKMIRGGGGVSES